MSALAPSARFLPGPGPAVLAPYQSPPANNYTVTVPISNVPNRPLSICGNLAAVTLVIPVALLGDQTTEIFHVIAP